MSSSAWRLSWLVAASQNARTKKQEHQLTQDVADLACSIRPPLDVHRRVARHRDVPERDVRHHTVAARVRNAPDRRAVTVSEDHLLQSIRLATSALETGPILRADVAK